MIRKVGVAIALLTALAVPVGAQNVNLMLSTMPAGKDPQRYKGYVEPKYKEFEQRSVYLTMRDGVKIAIDVVLPKPLAAGEKLPAIMNMTRYWRSRQGDKPGTWFPSHGYAHVLVDARDGSVVWNLAGPILSG
jgi:predicted acyl esterase